MNLALTAEDELLRRAYLSDCFVLPIFRKGRFVRWRLVPTAARMARPVSDDAAAQLRRQSV